MDMGGGEDEEDHLGAQLAEDQGDTNKYVNERAFSFSLNLFYFKILNKFIPRDSSPLGS